MTHQAPEVNVWTGGAMHAEAALDQLAARGGLISRIVVSDYPTEPTYTRWAGEPLQIARNRYDGDLGRWRDNCVHHAKLAGAKEAARLIARHASIHAKPVHWAEEIGPERALSRLAAEFCRMYPNNRPAYAFGPASLIAETAQQGVLGLPGSPRDLAAGFAPMRSLAFMTTVLAFFEQPDLAYPVIVAHDAYAIGYSGSCQDGATITVGVMPQTGVAGVSGATVSQLAARADEILKPGEAPDFDPNDFKSRLALRRLLGKSDNPG